MIIYLIKCFKKSYKLMNSDRCYQGFNPQPGFSPEDIINQSMIIVSSDSDSESQIDIKDQPSSQIIVSQRNQSKIKTSQILKIYQQVQAKEKKDAEFSSLKKQLSNKDKLQQEKIRKLFPSYKYLPIDSLKRVMHYLDDIAHDSNFSVVIVENTTQFQQKCRQQQLIKLTKVILLALQEIKSKKEVELNEKQYKLFQGEYDILRYAHRIASEIQLTFFKKLYNKISNKIGGCYYEQIRLIITQFNDKNNFELRRKIITRDYSLKDLTKANEQTLICQKTKLQQHQKMRQMVRQNEKKYQENKFKIDQPIISYYSFNSLESKGETNRQENPRIRKKLEKKDQIKKNKLICKEAKLKMIQVIKEMKERISKLKRSGLKKNFADKLKFNYDINIIQK